MDTAWRIIDCSSLEGRITSNRGAICIHQEDGGEHRVPTADVAVILMGPHVSFSTAVIHRLLGADVVVLFCDWRGVPEGAAYPWHEHGHVGARQRAQSQLSEPRRKNAWGRLVRAKVLGQAAVLHQKDRPAAARLKEMARSVRSGDPENVEAHAARLYWSRLFASEGDFLRRPEAEDHRNSCLNYGYAVLRAHGIRAVVSAGLNPTLGLFHHGRGNMFNLVDDIIEPFRPAVDDAVLHLDPDANPGQRQVKQVLVTSVQQPFRKDGATLPTVLEELAQHLGQYCEGDRARLDVPSWTGPRREP
ncbi:type II CRISPR-associated endonuclease Cas1 [Actinomyces naeslundii]